MAKIHALPIVWAHRFVSIASILFLTACASAGTKLTPTVFQPVSSPTAESVTGLPEAAVAPEATASPVPSELPTQVIPQTGLTAEPTLPVQPMASVPDPGGYTWQAVATGLSEPIGLADAGDGSGRLFVLEQAGRIRIIQNGAALDQPFLDITDRVGSGGSEQGLLGLAFHPDYPDSPYFYVNYTDKNGDTHISRFQAEAGANQIDPATEKILIQADQPYANHNGGSVVFGPDGYLYLGLGDGGSGGDPHGNGQSLDTLLGKILRIDVNNGDPYSIPADNPFVNGGGEPEIWAYGLRNPWRFSFDRQTGDLFIADVGQNEWEEVDYLPAGSPFGANFGWDYREGMHDFENSAPEGLALIEPIWEYSHSEGGCSITGGHIYRGQNLPAWNGVYFAADYCSGKVWGLIPNDGQWTGTLIYQTDYAISSFGEDANGELYLLDRNGGVYQFAQK